MFFSIDKVENELEKKASKNWAERRFNDIEKSHAELKVELKNIYKSLSIVNKTNQAILKDIGEWRMFKKIFISLLGLFVATLLGATIQFFQLRYDVEELKSKVIYEKRVAMETEKVVDGINLDNKNKIVKSKRGESDKK